MPERRIAMSEDRVSIEEKELEKVTGGAGTGTETQLGNIKTVICCKCGQKTAADFDRPPEFLGFCEHCGYRLRAEDVEIVD